MNLKPSCFFFCSAKASIQPLHQTLLLPDLNFLLVKSLCQEHIINDSLIAAKLHSKSRHCANQTTCRRLHMYIVCHSALFIRSTSMQGYFPTSRAGQAACWQTWSIKTLIACASRIFILIEGLLHSLASVAPVHFVSGRLPLLLCQLVNCQRHRLSLCKCMSCEPMQAR